MTPEEIANALVDAQYKRALAEVEVVKMQAHMHRTQHDVYVFEAEIKRLQAEITGRRLGAEVARIMDELKVMLPEEPEVVE